MTLFKKKEKFVPKKYVIFNVSIFNSWWNDPENGAVYANPGIFLRTDKLSIAHIHDYLVKCHGLNLSDWDIEEDIRSFFEEIRKDWVKKSKAALFLDDSELKRLIWEEWESEIKEEDPRRTVFKYMKMMRDTVL